MSQSINDAVGSFVAALESGSYYEDPGSALAALRNVGPILNVPLAGGAWLCTTWAGCVALARDPRISVARTDRMALAFPAELRGEAKKFFDLLRDQVLFLDPPRHTQIRKLLNRAFTPQAIALNRVRISEIFDYLLDEWIARGESEIMRNLVHPFPAVVIADWMGLPRDEWPRFLVWADALIRVVNATATSVDAEAVRGWLALVEESRVYLESVVAGRSPGGSDLFGLLMEMEEGEVLDREQLVAQALLILAAGHETTRNLIGSGLYWLLSNSFDFREFSSDEVAQRLAVDELLRLTSPVAIIGRVVTEDFEFEGVFLRKGDYILLAWASANRDPEQFPGADRMDLRRRNNPHLAFGAGLHACLGLHLARIEAGIAFERLWMRLPNLRLSQPPPEWNRLVGIHGPVRLHVAYDRV